MALRSNLISVPCQSTDGSQVTMVNAGLRARNIIVMMKNIICQDGTGSFTILVNAAIYGRLWFPQPFSSAGIQNPEIWGAFNFGPGYVGHSYASEWYIENIAQPVVFSIDDGFLPPGLELFNIGNSARGRISGTPTEVGDYTFIIRATGPTADATNPFEITVSDIDVPDEGTGFVSGN